MITRVQMSVIWDDACVLVINY